VLGTAASPYQGTIQAEHLDVDIHTNRGIHIRTRDDPDLVCHQIVYGLQASTVWVTSSEHLAVHRQECSIASVDGSTRDLSPGLTFVQWACP